MAVLAEQTAVDRVLEKINEASTWVKTQAEAFFKLLSQSIIRGLWGVKSFITKCCEKFKQVLEDINGSIDAGKKKLSEKEKLVSPDMHSLLVELKKLVHHVQSGVYVWLEVADDHESRLKGREVKGFCDLVDGFIELLQLVLEQSVKLIPIILNGFLLYQHIKTTNRPVNIMKFPTHKGNATGAIAILLGLLHTNFSLV